MISEMMPILNEFINPIIVCDKTGKTIYENDVAITFFKDLTILNLINIKEIDPEFDYYKILKSKKLEKSITIMNYSINTTISSLICNNNCFIFYSFKPYLNIDKSIDLITEHIDDVIVLFDEQGKIKKMNSICDEILPFKRSEAIGRFIDDLISEGYVYNPIMKDMLISEITLHRNVSYPNGKIISYTATPIFENNILRGGILTGRDITRIIRLMSHVNSASNQIDTKEYISKSSIMKQIKEMCIKAASTDSSIFISGESGTGKEVLANMIHNYSKRREQPFIAINCGAIPSELLESELFGYEEGAFTGSKKGGKKGLLEEASGGTIFFDEIGELPLNMQTKLLRVIQELKITRVGGTSTIPIDVRFICATNIPINELKSNRSFRLDLYYRLSVVPVNIPPLRDRSEDILPLVDYFLKQFNSKYERKLVFSKEAFEAISNYTWPGNIRELKNVIERLVILNSSDIVSESDFNILLNLDSIQSYNPKTKNISIQGYSNLHEVYEAVNQIMIPDSIRKNGSIVKAASELGINPSTIHRKIKDGDIIV